MSEQQGVAAGYEKNLKKALAEKEKTWHLQISLLTTEVKELSACIAAAACVQLSEHTAGGS